ncbi:hypothetical protein LTR97_007748 [Elasticomyces elasticus]|uniref:Uncharacterized protein n=1 Tax=Elasticomyces elasticus TaxID=574655 RepID=A0AAN7W417_9PEZI|nr:hypothetical protein LTR97_007748 [Elasticomyces elasticus]
MSFTKIIIAAALAVSAMAAPTSNLLEERATDGVVIATYNLGGQGCTLNQGGSTSVFTIPISANGTCTPFSGFPPYQVKSAKTLSVTGNYHCKVVYNDKCGDVQGTPGPTSVCETANKYFGGVYILCNAK